MKGSVIACSATLTLGIVAIASPMFKVPAEALTAEAVEAVKAAVKTEDQQATAAVDSQSRKRKVGEKGFIPESSTSQAARIRKTEIKQEPEEATAPAAEDIKPPNGPRMALGWLQRGPRSLDLYKMTPYQQRLLKLNQPMQPETITADQAYTSAQNYHTYLNELLERKKELERPEALQAEVPKVLQALKQAFHAQELMRKSSLTHAAEFEGGKGGSLLVDLEQILIQAYKSTGKFAEKSSGHEALKLLVLLRFMLKDDLKELWNHSMKTKTPLNHDAATSLIGDLDKVDNEFMQLVESRTDWQKAADEALNSAKELKASYYNASYTRQKPYIT